MDNNRTTSKSLQQGSAIIVGLIILALVLVGGYVVYHGIGAKSSAVTENRKDLEQPGIPQTTTATVPPSGVNSGTATDTQLDTDEKSLEGKINDLNKDSSGVDQGLNDKPGDLTE